MGSDMSSQQILPPPLLDALVEGRVLPLIGAGFSLNAILPEGRRMPTWIDLGRELAREVTYLGPGVDPLEAVSAYAAEHGRQALVARLRKSLQEGYSQPGSAHLAFAELPFDVVATTNFDTLLEQAYTQAGRPLHVVTREDQLALQYPQTAISVVKAHGDLNNEPVLVASEEDYDEFLLRRPLLATYLGNLLITRVGLLIGYSFSDRNWRELLAAVRSRLGRGRQSVYAIAVDSDVTTSERFRRRGVQLINVPSEGRSCEETLRRVFEQIHSHIAQHALDGSTIRDEAALEELRADDRHGSRLCLFLLPERRVAFYREQVFPLLRQSGVSPVTPYDVDTINGGLFATAIALLDRARAAVVDISVDGSGTRFEVGLALNASARGKDTALAIITDAHYPSALDGREVFLLNDPLDDPDFPRKIRDWAVSVLGLQEEQHTDAVSVKDSIDPGWKILRAFRDLELELRTRYPDGPSGLSSLLARARREGALSQASVTLLREDFRIRNRALHEHYAPNVDEAAQVTEHVMKALEELDSDR